MTTRSGRTVCFGFTCCSSSFALRLDLSESGHVRLGLIGLAQAFGSAPVHRDEISRGLTLPATDQDP